MNIILIGFLQHAPNYSQRAPFALPESTNLDEILSIRDRGELFRLIDSGKKFGKIYAAPAKAIRVIQ